MPTLLEAIRLKYGACAEEEWPSVVGSGGSDGVSGGGGAGVTASAATAAASPEASATAHSAQGKGVVCVESGAGDAGAGPVSSSGGEVPVAIFVPRRSPRRAVPALLVLNDCGIEAAGDARALRSACRAVEELDLAQNRLGRWREVLGILQQAPRVRFLNLSFNRLAGPLRLDDTAPCAACAAACGLAPLQPPPQRLRPDTDSKADSFPCKCSAAAAAAAAASELNGGADGDGGPMEAEGLCTPPPSPPPVPLPPLRALVLNGTRVSWDSVSRLLGLLPGLEELHLSLNELREVALGTNAHAQLRRLFFNRNPVSEWNQVARLGAAFPKLEVLSLADCPLRSLRAHAPPPTDVERALAADMDSSNSAAEEAMDAEELASGGDARRSYARSESAPEAEKESRNRSGEGSDVPHHQFRRLRCLNVSGTLLSDWDDVDRLARFPTLSALRISGCPLLEARQEHTQYERRQLLIARLPNVRTLNGGGLISAEEREDAERAFIRYCMDKPEADRPERYNDLVAIHGRLDPLVQVDLSPEKRVKVRITYGEHSENRSLHVYQTVADLKQKLESFTGLPAIRMKLFYVDATMGTIHGPEEMRYPSKRLYSYNIANGDEIIVDVKQRTNSSGSSSTHSMGNSSDCSSGHSSSNNNNGGSSNRNSNGINNNVR